LATYRQIHINIWDDPRFEEYSPHAKLLFIYGFSNKHRNEAGLYSISIKKFAFETGLSIEETESALKEITASGSWKYDYEAKVLWIVNALKYQSVNDKCLIAINRDIQTISIPMKEEFKTHCNTIGYPLDTHVIPKGKGIDTQAGKGKGKGKGKDINKGKNLSLEIEQFRSRYSPEQLEIIDRYFEILRTTRRSGTIAESIIHGVYADMNRYDPLIVEYACCTVVKNPKLHDKKENYFGGILRNTTIDEAVKELSGGRKNIGFSKDKTALIDQIFDKMEASNRG
jgi:hypothetical protein